MTAREDAQLADAVGQQLWAREVLARSGRFLPGLGTRPVGSSAMPQPKKSESPAPTQAVLGFVPKEMSDGTPLPTIPRDSAHSGTVWVPRLLWGLEWARRNLQKGVTPADLSRILKQYGEIDVPDTNVARAFRELRRNREVNAFWKCRGKRYEITDVGIAILNGLLADIASS
jgi:hypothetical protein